MRGFYRTKDSVSNWFPVLQKSLSQRGFKQNVDIEHYPLIRNDYTVITHADDSLIFYKNDKTLDDLIIFLKDEFKLTEEGNLETFLGVTFKNHGHNKMELAQLCLMQSTIDTLGLQD